MRCSCGKVVLACTASLPGDPCMVRCLHERPRLPSRKLPCRGWVHADGWHLCDPSISHSKMAEPVKE
jgi:hypothetical protein